MDNHNNNTRKDGQIIGDELSFLDSLLTLDSPLSSLQQVRLLKLEMDNSMIALNYLARTNTIEEEVEEVGKTSPSS